MSYGHTWYSGELLISLLVVSLNFSLVLMSQLVHGTETCNMFGSVLTPILLRDSQGIVHLLSRRIRWDRNRCTNDAPPCTQTETSAVDKSRQA